MKKNDFCAAARILSALAFAVVAAIVPNLTAALAALIFSIFSLVYFRPSPRKLFERWVQINIFVVFIWLLTPWTTPGTSFGSWKIFTYEGVFLSALVTLKTNALFFVFYTLVSPLSFTQLADGLKSLHFPVKLTAILLFCSRGIDIFQAEYRHTRDAMKLRGFEMKADKRTYQTVGAIIALLFSKAFRKGAVLEEAMVLRGYDGTVRTLSHEEWSTRDSILLALYVCAAIVFALFSLS